MQRARGVLMAAAAAWVLSPWLSAQAASAPATAQSAQQAKAQHKLAQVRAQIEALVAQQRRSAGQRDQLHAGLAKQARSLAAAAAAVVDAQQAVVKQRAALRPLQAQITAVQNTLHAQRGALADLLRAAYALHGRSGLHLLLGALAQCPAPAASAASAAPACGDHDRLARLDRALAYSSYFQHDRAARVHALLADLAHLQALQAEAKRAQAALQRAVDERKARVARLQSQRKAQRKALAIAEAKLRGQGKQLTELKRDQRNLEQLLQRLDRVLAELPAQLPGEIAFAKLRGRLPWPLHGKLARYRDGVRISAKPGTPVHAVAHGRVVYADWLRGYGMLLIVDNGDGWLSLYGDNESLRRQVGDWVDAGAIIATSGRGSVGAGVYFGLRHRGDAVDPRRWLRHKR